MTPLRASVCQSVRVSCGEDCQLGSSRWISAVTIVILFAAVGRGGWEVEAAWFLCTARVLRVEFVA